MSRVVQVFDWQLFVERCRTGLKAIPALVSASPTGEIYERIIEMDFGGSYHLMWDVAQAQNIAHRENVLPHTIVGTRLVSAVATEDLDIQRANRLAPSQGNIIVADFPLLAERCVVIDGNHRVYRAHHTGTFVSAIALNEAQMFEALIHDRFRLYYTIHWNISRWLTIEVTGNIPFPHPWLNLTPNDISAPPLIK